MPSYLLKLNPHHIWPLKNCFLLFKYAYYIGICILSEPAFVSNWLLGVFFFFFSSSSNHFPLWFYKSVWKTLLRYMVGYLKPRLSGLQLARCITADLFLTSTAAPGLLHLPTKNKLQLTQLNWLQMVLQTHIFPDTWEAFSSNFHTKLSQQKF